MRLIFMGTPEFAVPSLEALIEAGHRVEAVVTQPDRPHGRGRQMAPSAVKEAALSRKIPVLQPERVRQPEFVEILREMAPEIIVVVAFGQILPVSILEIPPFGCVNVHGSLLPRYRGAAPIQHAIIRGETETGITTMQMDKGMDTGAILLRSTTPIGLEETAGDLAKRLSQVGAMLLLETLVGLEAGRLTPIPQDSTQATMAPSLSRDDGRIDWSRRALEVHNRARGCNPRPGAFSFLHGELLKLWQTQPLETGPAAVEPGAVIEIGEDSVVVQAGFDSVRLMQVQPEARKRMTGAEFARGHGLRVGDRLG